MTLADGNEQWQQPSEGMIKINTDAACFVESNSYVFSMIARDRTGGFVEARALGKQGYIDPTMAETVSIREALSWIKGKLWRGVILESDCLAMIQAIRCSYVNLSYLGRIINECKDLLAELQTHNVKVNFVKRSANKIAHNIARNSSSIAERRWIKVNVLPHFFDVMFAELKF